MYFLPVNQSMQCVTNLTENHSLLEPARSSRFSINKILWGVGQRALIDSMVSGSSLDPSVAESHQSLLSSQQTAAGEGKQLVETAKDNLQARYGDKKG